MARVKDILKGRKFVAVDQNTTIKKIAKILLDKKLTNVPVTDNSGNLLGVVSEKDIIKSFNAPKFESKKAKDVMTKRVVSVKEDDALEKVAKIFSDKMLRKLPVVKQGKVIGVITRDDVISCFMNYY